MSVSREGLEKLAQDLPNRGIPNRPDASYDNGWWDATAGAVNSIRALLAEAREGGKPAEDLSFTCQECGKVFQLPPRDHLDRGRAFFELCQAAMVHDTPSGDPCIGHIGKTPASAGTEGPGLDVDAIVRRVYDEHPSGDANSAEMGRYTWPERFDALIGYVKAALAARPVEGEKK